MVELREITEDNYQDCLKLKVAEHQKKSVASNVVSLAQAWVFRETTYPFAIYANEVMVGFVMMGFDKEINAYDIWRFMIDEKCQRKGYGKSAILLAIEFLKKECNVNEIYLSFEPDNVDAEKLYESVGFKKTGALNDGELVMRLDIESTK